MMDGVGQILFWIIVIALGILIRLNHALKYSCLNENGDPVDWFIVYKLPDINKHPNSYVKQGLGYLYLDSRNVYWTLGSNSINSSQCALGRTVGQIYSSKADPEIFRLLYNDAHPKNKSDSYRGHTKGVLLFDSSAGYWLMHSVPQFPSRDTYSYPESGRRNGQSILCVSFSTSSLHEIAPQLRLYQPSIYDSQLSTQLAQLIPELQEVVAGKALRKGPYFTHATINSAGGTPFSNFAKHKKWGKDIYADFMAPNLKQSLFVQTWLNGPRELPSDCASDYKVNNLRSVKLTGVEFLSSKDHSKWALSVDKRNPYVCIGDINRQQSQSTRSGGAMCLRNELLWELFHDAVGKVEDCPIGSADVSRSGSSSQRPAHSRNAQEMPHIELGQLRTQNPPVARTSDQNIRALKEQEQKLISKRSEIQAKIKEKSALARSGHAQNNMQQVKVALIQKKQYEKQLVLYNNFLGDIEELRAELENVSQDQELQNFIEEQRAMSVAVSNVLDRPTGDDLTEEEENELTVELEELLRE
uniref:Deoxyribonuclease II n=1 Tax=Plectus sambesii TaxID=2011161 RepID=A0A914WQT2_9BILA